MHAAENMHVVRRYVLMVSSRCSIMWRNCANGRMCKVVVFDGVQDGFIHMTADPDLLLEVANRFYKSSDGDWEVLVIDPAKLTAEVRDVPCCQQSVISSVQRVHLTRCSQHLTPSSCDNLNTAVKLSAVWTYPNIETLHEQVKFEAAAPVGSTAARPSDDRRWPHLYGTLDHDAVLQRLAIRRDADGSFLSIEHSEQAEGSSSSAA